MKNNVRYFDKRKDARKKDRPSIVDTYQDAFSLCREHGHPLKVYIREAKNHLCQVFPSGCLRDLKLFIPKEKISDEK